MTRRASEKARGRTPVLFVGHGSPMNAIEENAWSAAFHALAKLLPTPAGIVSISAHWYVPGTFATGNDKPRTIHDFGGFPRELFEIEYPARGDAALAARLVDLLGGNLASVRLDWGLDHGTWTVLRHLRPEADCRVVQLSIDYRLPPERHIEIGRALAPLRDDGVLIMGSGNIVHNLEHAFMSYSNGIVDTPPWAAEFDADVAAAAGSRDQGRLAALVESRNGRMSHPTLDHYLPLLYAAGAADARDAVRFPISGFDMSSISMRAVLYG